MLYIHGHCTSTSNVSPKARKSCMRICANLGTVKMYSLLFIVSVCKENGGGRGGLNKKKNSFSQNEERESQERLA